MNVLNTIRIDHIGSLVRPAKLKDVFARYDRGQVSREQLGKVQDEAIRDVIQKQEAHGFPIVTDGEFRRHSFQESFSECVIGFDVPKNAALYYEKRDVNETPLERAEQNFDEAGPAIVTRRGAGERLRLVRNFPLEEFRYARSVAKVPPKVTLIGPDRVAQRFDHERSKGVYSGMDDFVQDVVAIQRRMVRQLVDAGCRYVHIDAPGYTAYVDEPSLAAMRARGEDPWQNFARSLKADAALIDGFPGVTFGIHLCRGNQRSMWHREGSYDAIAERLFNELPHQRFLLEYDSPRAGSFAPLRFVPKGKIVVLGLVSTKVPRLEPVDELKRRIDEAARLVPLENLALSPQCGFGSDVVGNLVSEDDQKRKLERVVETARQVWR